MAIDGIRLNLDYDRVFRKLKAIPRRRERSTGRNNAT
jgi:hypothetical protein